MLALGARGVLLGRANNVAFSSHPEAWNYSLEG